MRNKIKKITYAAIIAALYVALTYGQNMLLPGSASMAIQFRAAEALCVLAFFTPAAIPGLTIGCLLFNISNGAIPLDFIIGSAASLLAAWGMWQTRKVTLLGYPLLAMLLPAVWNGLLVGWELSYLMGGGFWINAAYVATGEAAVLLTVGSVVYFAMKKHANRIFG